MKLQTKQTETQKKKEKKREKKDESDGAEGDKETAGKWQMGASPQEQDAQRIPD